MHTVDSIQVIIIFCIIYRKNCGNIITKTVIIFLVELWVVFVINVVLLENVKF